MVGNRFTFWFILCGQFFHLVVYRTRRRQFFPTKKLNWSKRRLPIIIHQLFSSWHMLQKLFVTVLMISLTAGLHAQLNAADSLQKILANEKEDTVRCMLYANLSTAYLNFIPEKALEMGEKG